jgi:hypothetical protein
MSMFPGGEPEMGSESKVQSPKFLSRPEIGCQDDDWKTGWESGDPLQ